MELADPQTWLAEHGDALYAFAMLHLRDTHRSEDLVQETLLSALQAWQGFRGDCAVRTWLTGIMKHKILDEFRRREREPSVDDRVGDEADAAAAEADFVADGHWRRRSSDWGDPLRSLDGERLRRVIERCIETLSPRAARLFVLRELWEMDTEQVCKELAISSSNLWTGLHRARLAMRRCLQRNHVDSPTRDD